MLSEPGYARRADSRSWKWKLAAAVVASWPLHFVAAQTTYTWINSAGGDYFNANNWDPTGYPDPNTGQDSAVFSLDSTYTVTVDQNNNPDNTNGYASVVSAAFTAGDVTIDTVNYTGFYSDSGAALGNGLPSLQVADDPTNIGQTASLTITTSDGTGRAGAQAVGVGMYSNSIGTLTLDGNGSAMVFGSNFYTLVGYSGDGAAGGDGTMNVINGTQFNTPQSYIDGTVHVGSGASWDNTTTDPYGATPTLRVGVSSTANMLVDNTNTDATNTTTMLKTNDLVMGVDASSNGTLTIQGSQNYSYAAQTTWTGNTVEIGVLGAALLNIEQNATATVNSIDIGTANRDAIDTGTVDELNVQNNGTLTITGALRVGVGDIGTLNIGQSIQDPNNPSNYDSTNGTVNCDSAIIGVNGPGTAVVGNGYSFSFGGPSIPVVGTLNVTNTLTVGQYPDTATGDSETSSLTINDGGLVTSSYGIVGDQNDPINGPSEGQVTIDGSLGLGTTAVSTWQVTNDLTIGNYGQGIVTVDDGGTLQVGGNIYLGENSMDDGEVLSTGSLYVNQSDSSNPGFYTTSVSAANLYLGGSASAAGGGGNVQVTGGTVKISNSAYIYSNSSMSVNGTGMIAIGVDAAGDIPDPGFGALIVGASQAGTLTATGGVQYGYSEIFASQATIGDGAVGTLIMNGGFLQNDGAFSYEFSATLQVPGTTIVSNTAASSGSSLLLENGGSAYPQILVIGNQTGSSGNVTVTGISSDGYIESYLEVDTSVTIGNYGAGALAFAAGAHALLNNVSMATNPGSSGTLSADGINTDVTVSNTLDTGLGGIVNITNGGTIIIGAPYVPHPGTLTVGSSGTLKGSGTINAVVYDEPYGTVSPGDAPGILTINGSYTETEESFFNVTIDGPGAGVGYDQLDVLGLASIDGTLEVTFADDVPAGDYLILTSTGLTGVFPALDLINAPTHVFIDYTADGVFVDVPAVPEPATLSLLALPLLALRRRRQ